MLNFKERSRGDAEEPYLVADINELAAPSESSLASRATTFEERVRKRLKRVERRVALLNHEVLELIHIAGHPARTGHVDEQGRRRLGLDHTSMIPLSPRGTTPPLCDQPNQVVDLKGEGGQAEGADHFGNPRSFEDIQADQPLRSRHGLPRATEPAVVLHVEVRDRVAQ